MIELLPEKWQGPKIESAKLRALRALVPRVPHSLRSLKPYVPRALRALVSHLPSALRAFVLCVSRVLRAVVSYVPQILRALVPHVPRAICTSVFHLPRASRASCPVWTLASPFMSPFSYVPYCFVTCILYVLISPFVFLSFHASRSYFSVNLLLVIFLRKFTKQSKQIYCLYVQNTHSFRSQQNGWIFTIFHQFNCKSDFVIYVLECKRCHIQYVGKAKTNFNLRLKNDRKDVYKADAIPLSRHFAMKDHIFNKRASFITIEQIRKSALSREIKKKLLKQRENFWTLKLENY